LEEELSSMVPDENASIEECLMKFRLLVTQLKECGKTKLDEEFIFLILSKLKGPYHIFSSSFYSTMDALGSEFKVPSFEIFCEHLTREKSNYITQLDSLFGSNNKVLMAYTSKTKKKKYSSQDGESTSKHYYIWADYSMKIFHVSTSFIFFLNRAGFSSLLPRKFVAISMKILFK
jgi:hypothetical protein